MKLIFYNVEVGRLMFVDLPSKARSFRCGTFFLVSINLTEIEMIVLKLVPENRHLCFIPPFVLDDA